MVWRITKVTGCPSTKPLMRTPTATYSRELQAELSEENEWYTPEVWINRPVTKYIKAHPECPHFDEEGYLGVELMNFNERDVIIRDSQGLFLAGTRQSLNLSIATIYRWM